MQGYKWAAVQNNDTLQTIVEANGGKALVFDMPDEDYFAYPAIGSSHLVDVLECPRKYWSKTPWCPYVTDEELKELLKEKESEALFYGKAMHTYLLEPHAFEERYLVKPDPVELEALMTVEDMHRYAEKKGAVLPSLKKADLARVVKQRFPEANVWCLIEEEYKTKSEQQGAILVDAKTKASIKCMADEIATEMVSIEGKDYLLGSVFNNGAAEAVAIWKHPKTGLYLKIRIDWLLANIIFEYRTAINAHPKAFRAAAVKRNYHVRAGMYWHVLHEVTGNVPDFYYIVQEKKPAFLNSTLEQSQDDLLTGWALTEECLEVVAECLAKGDPKDKNNWPSYTYGKVRAIEFTDKDFEKQNQYRGT